MTTDKQRLNKAFSSLRKEGFTAKQKHACCQTCGLAELPEGVGKYVFYHMQDAEALKKDGMIDEHGLFLTWGQTEKDGRAIVSHIQAQGLGVDWDYTLNRRIRVMHRG